jgi:hypothetical protein
MSRHVASDDFQQDSLRGPQVSATATRGECFAELQALPSVAFIR